MPPTETDPIERKSSPFLFFTLGALFFLVSIWAFYDEFVSRRTWKKYQREFNVLELGRLQDDREKTRRAFETEETRQEQRKGPVGDSDLSLREIRLKIEAAEVRMESRESRQAAEGLKERLILLSDAEQRYGFAKADEEEVYYEWKHALEKGDASRAEAMKKEYDALEAKLVGLKEKSESAKAKVAEAKARVDRAKEGLKKWKDAEKERLEPLVRLEKKIESVRSRGLDIKQVVIEDLGKGAEVSWGTVDRCPSCHVAIDRDGFENEKNPFKTHPDQAAIFGSHPVEKFGCTVCHGGQGRATQIEGEPLGEGDFAHGLVPHWPESLLKGDAVQSSCTKCHLDQWKLDHAPVAMAGKKLFWNLGCTGCHAIKGFEGVPKVGPPLRKMKGKVYPEWLTSWIKNPRDYLPHTRMPTPPIDLEDDQMTEEERRQRGNERDQVLKVAAYLLQSSEPYGFPFGRYPGGDPSRGRKLFETVGCYGCHTLGEKGTGLAAALDRIAEKTSADWLYNWIQNPKAFNPAARMPSLRLTREEAADVTAFLIRQGDPPPEDRDLRDALRDPENAKKGYLLVSQFGCYGCHDIKGFEASSKLSVELTAIGKKDIVEFDFGDTDVPHTWKDWIAGKLQNPRRYLTEKTSSKMPNFHLTDDQVHALVVFLQGLKKQEVPEGYLLSKLRPHQKEIDDGRRLAERLNCSGCHLLEGEGRLIEPFVEAAGLPPNLTGIGARVRPEWMFDFLKNPGRVRIRPWIETRMPNFHLTDDQTNIILHYFSALDRVPSDFYSPTTPPAMDPEAQAAAQKLVSSDYFSCFSCHIRGSRTPASPPQQWGPDLTMVRERIRPEFIPEWLKDPQRFTPGVAMPAFLPDDASAPQDLLGGNREKQAEALRDYLLNLSP